MGRNRPAVMYYRPLIGFGCLHRARNRQFFDRLHCVAGAVRSATVQGDRSVCGFSEGNDAGGWGWIVRLVRARCRVGGVTEEGVERGLEAVATEQGFPHHRGNLQACTHRCAGAAAHHVDAELQPAQALLIGLWELAQKLLDQGKPARFEGGWIVLGQTRPFVEIKGETKICRCLHLAGPVTFGNSKLRMPSGGSGRRPSGRARRTGFVSAAGQLGNLLIGNELARAGAGTRNSNGESWVIRRARGVISSAGRVQGRRRSFQRF